MTPRPSRWLPPRRCRAGPERSSADGRVSLAPILVNPRGAKSVMNLLKDIMAYLYPLRVALFRGMRRLRNRYSGSHYYYRTVFNEVERPEYGYCIWKAAMLAKSLNHSRISIIELGVAKGVGLMSIEQHIENIKREIDMEFDVFGFGLEVGLPKPEDYQDMPFKWWEGGYEMNTGSLKKKLKITNLVLGDVKETSKTFLMIIRTPPQLEQCFLTWITIHRPGIPLRSFATRSITSPEFSAFSTIFWAPMNSSGS